MSTDLMVSYDCDAEIFDAMVNEFCFDPTARLDLDLSYDFGDGWPELAPLDMRDHIRMLTGVSLTQFFTTDQATELRRMLEAEDAAKKLPPDILLPTSEYQVVVHD